MNAPDVYQDPALAEITLTCHQCDARLDSEDLPDGQPRFPNAYWFVALANEAFRRGWLIEYVGPDASYFDYRIRCPQCANARSG